MRPARKDPSLAEVGGAAASFASDDLGLSFYCDPPLASLRVSEFEQFALSRLKVLHALDRICGHDFHLANVSEVRPKILQDMVDAQLMLAPPLPGKAELFTKDKTEFCRRDTISHFALRLAFCKTREARDWLLRQEQRLFVLRFDFLSVEAQEAFLTASGVRCEKYTKQVDGKPSILDLQKSTHGARIWAGQGSGAPDYHRVFYEMQFTEVHPGLIATRKVVLHGGIAYVPCSAMKLILASKFKESLSAGLDLAYHSLPNVLVDPRVGEFVRLLVDHGLQLLVAPKSSSEGSCEKLSLDNFDELLARSFPPCMRRLVENQREQKKHLKHAGRLQLRPFLKHCGFMLEESLAWWRREVCRDPEVDATIFDKNYTYDVEHTYGKKGHFQGQSCMGCPKTIGMAGEAVGQSHGCPFKQLELPALRQQLHKWRVPEASAKEIEKLIAHGKHYQLACVEYFKSMHEGHEGDGVGNTPSDFFRESCRYHLSRKEKEMEKLDGASTDEKS